jgi:predicted secreted hydrolase
MIRLVLCSLLLCACGSSSPSGGDAGATPDLASAPDHLPPQPEARPPGSDARAEARPESAINFPRDEAPHSTPIEWWYYTGTLQNDAKDTYGFEFVIFQTVILNLAVGYMSHFAITDLKKGAFTFSSKESVSDQRGGVSGFSLDVGGWKMLGHDGKDSLSASMPGYAVALSLAAKKPVALQYGTGWMTVGGTEPFYYYSYTRMGVTGSLTVDGTPQNVTGEAWMDHQWGDIGNDYRGWDWFSLRLDDNTEVMLFNVRRSGKPGFAGGTLVAADGSTQVLAGTDYVVTSTGQWKSPHNGSTYPQGWTISIPKAGLDVTVAALLPDQEFTDSFLGQTPIYWEGLCSATGTKGGKPITGKAYVELTSYNNP